MLLLHTIIIICPETKSQWCKAFQRKCLILVLSAVSANSCPIYNADE